MTKLLTSNAVIDAATEGSGGYFAAIMCLSPHTSAGLGNVCPWAEGSGCIELCNGRYSGRTQTPSVRAAQDRRTALFFDDRAAFDSQFRKELDALARKAAKQGKRLAVRPNGTSDLEFWALFDWMQDYPDVQFYDYTKSERRAQRYIDGELPPNYHLTFSWGLNTGSTTVGELLSSGVNVAVPFRKPARGAAMVERWRGHAVIDGDTSDLRFLDPPRVVVGLRAKNGRAKDNGFIQQYQAR